MTVDWWLLDNRYSSPSWVPLRLTEDCSSCWLWHPYLLIWQETLHFFYRIYYFKHMELYSSVALSTLTLLGNSKHHLSLEFLTFLNWTLSLLNTTSPFCLLNSPASLMVIVFEWILEFKNCYCLGTPWMVALQAPLSMEFLRQEYWSGLPFPSPGDLPEPGIKPTSPSWQADSFPLSHQGSPGFNSANS